jgi:succinate-semialdehyde dehydrogenase / glutarate-semialdehyde dehydrogenase
MFQSINPFTQELLGSFPLMSTEGIEQVLTKASSAASIWKRIPISKRAESIMALAQQIEKRHEKLARLATIEMGKPYAEAKLEVLKCMTACEYYASNAETIIKPIETMHTDGRMVIQLHEPLGTVLGVFPWNFPYWQIIRSAIPVIMSGNTMVVKPAPNVPQCALVMQELFDEAGLGDGIVQTVFADEAQIALMIADSRIHACTLTGSERAGAAVAGAAAHEIKKSVLELGGSDPFIVLADADLELVRKNAVSARFQNNGQSCIASKRYIVHSSVADIFLTNLITDIHQLKMGNPMEADVNIGPLARIDLKEKIAKQVEQSVKEGARILYQANYPHEGTCFYPPTILGGIPPNSVAYKEELFGPVLSFYVVDSTEEAIALANDTAFGLGATLWTFNKQQAIQLAGQIESGQVFINAVTRSHTAYPFGGIKRSGYGREMGAQGLLEFCSLKTIWV